MNFYKSNIVIVIWIVWQCININIYTQESHFSQTHKIPVINNPANAGIMDYEMRITNNYRNQWRSINIGYNTLHFGLDKKFHVLNQNLGISINVLKDFSQSNIIESTAFSFALSYCRFFQNHQFSGGFHFGEVIKNFNPSKLTFGEQFDPDLGIFNPFQLSGEDNLESELTYEDLSAGLLWRSKLNTLEPLIGFSIHHLNRPMISFVNDQYDEHLSLKYTFHSNILIPLIKKYSITPILYYSYMGKSHELIGGSVLGYNPDDFIISVNKIYANAFFRLNPARNIDAMILGGGIEFYNFDLGVSYDFNISSLRKITNFQGAFEISLIFIYGRPRKKGSTEPCYMM